MRLKSTVCVSLWGLLSVLGCASPPQAPVASADAAADSAVDVAPSEDAKPASGQEVWLTFEVDDSANKTFTDGDIKWTGSFSWDAKTNSIVPATSWLPTDGPYPLLYDDGPISAGGHEHEGAKAGDHIFSTAVKFTPEDDTVFEYGALNEFDNWMWIGPNGQLEVLKDASGTIAAKGLVLPAHGDVDFKLELDTNALNEKYTKWKVETHKFYAKGTMNMWTPVQLLDDGKKGDVAAGDGKLTYVQSDNLGKHDGLLSVGQEIQFVFVTTTGDAFPDAGQEYKGATEAYKEGVKAWTRASKDAPWVEATVELKVDSKGKFKNTAIVVPEGATSPACDPPCEAGQKCVEGKCVDEGPQPCDPACGAGQKCVEGKCVDDGPLPCDPACGAGQKCVEGKCVDDGPLPCDPVCGAGQKCVEGKCVDDGPKPCTPACKADEVCDNGSCVPKTCNPACASDQKCVVDQCVDLLAITAVNPAKGPMAGGTKVTITGKGFAAGASVTFAGNAATGVKVLDAKTMTCETPAGKTGPAVVEVTVGADKASKADAFEYDKPPKPTALLLQPVAYTVEEGTAVPEIKVLVKVPTVSQKPGPTPGMKASCGVGVPGSKPDDASAKWAWKDAVFSAEDTTKGEETWTCDFAKLPLGVYAYTVRVTYEQQTAYGDADGSENGYDPAKAGSITVTKPDLTPKVTGFEPPYVPWTGGKVIILGKNLSKDIAVSLKSDFAMYPELKASGATVIAGKGVEVTLSPGALGIIPPVPATLSATPKGGTQAAITPKIDVVPVATPTLDGDPQMSDWKGPVLQATATSEWSQKNSLSQLFVAYDKTNLYIGAAGTVESTNAIVGYVDVDYGAKTGVQSPYDLKDNSGALDDALSNVLKVTDALFGADFALGTLGMKSQLTGKPADAASAGWRSLAKADDLAWLGGKLVAQSGKGIEASIPLATLYPKGIPAKGVTLTLFLKVVNANGSVAPKGAALPDQKSTDAATIDTVYAVRMYPLP